MAEQLLSGRQCSSGGSQSHLYIVRLAIAEKRSDLARHGLAVDHQRCDALAHVLRVVDAHFVCGAAENPRRLEAVPSLRNAGIDLKAFVARAKAQDMLGSCLVHPARRAGEPAVATEAELRMLIAQDVLSVYIWFEIVLF